METTVHAIVLKRTNAGESDRRLTLLTREFGKIDAIAKGARKAASRLAGMSDPLSASVMTLASSRKTRYVTQAQPLSSFRGLRTDFDRLTYGLALIELVDGVMPWQQEDPDAFDALTASLQHLERHDKPLVALAWSEVQLLMATGFMPQLTSCVVTGTTLTEANPFLSPEAGGYVSESAAPPFADRFRARAEVLIGLSRLAEVETPPNNLRFVEECVVAMLPFWRHIHGMALPANDVVISELRSQLYERQNSGAEPGNGHG